MRLSLSGSILSTLSYHSKFNYPLTLPELHRFLLINRPVSSNEVKLELIKLVVQGKVKKEKKYFYLPQTMKQFSNETIKTIRPIRKTSSLPKLKIATKAGRILSFLPWIKLVCVTGSLAMENSDETDDIDLMIVTPQNRLWLARPLVIFLVALFFVRRKPLSKGPTLPRQGRTLSESRPDFSNSICLNLWLDETALKMENHRRNLRTAHELAQMKPLVNKNHTYEKMLSLNKWGAKFLANFWSTIQQFNNLAINNKTNNSLNLLNSFLFRLQLRYMSRRRTTEEVNLHAAFFHPSEHSENSENR